MKALDFKDVQIGGIIPRKRFPKYKGDKTYWQCECVYCGEMKMIPLDSIKRGMISCGCIKKDLTGTFYGDIEILKMLPKTKEVECRCHKCNSIFTYSSSRIKHMTSCVKCSRDASGAAIAATLNEKGYFKNNTYLCSWNGERALNKNNTSGHVGVSYDKSRGKWKAYIKFQGKDKLIGRFDDKETAIKVREMIQKEIQDRLDNNIDFSLDDILK